MFSPDLVDSRSENLIVDLKELARWRRVKCVHERIHKNLNLPRSMRNTREWLTKRAVDCWRLGYDGMAKWHEEKKDVLFDFANFYEGEAAKAFKELRGDRSKESSGSSDSVMHSWWV